ncbi:MAG TPA: EthD family reductase [Solirubrobacteraceae bacterium]|jgi:uncharacterized protein (TIGR02118 family)|nr:EthD family reductase [Solirubrobacteraceae bacterium]
MVKLIVAYGPPADPDAFDQHYESTHKPLAEKIPELRRFEAGKVLGTPDGSTAPYHLIAELYFDDVPALQAAMGTAEGQAAAGDVANFATGGATMMIAEA